jgi:hypothetical protein
MNLMIFLLAVLLVGGSFSAVYLALIRPALIFWMRRMAVAVRDDLELAVLCGEIGDHEKAVQPTMGKLDALIRGCEHIGVMSVFFTMRSDASITYEAERDAQTGREAGSAMKEIIRRADMLVVATIVLNSPFFWFVLPPIYALGTLTGRITRWINSVSLSSRDGSHHGHHGGLATA